jgi:hypothetical protein
LGVAFNWIVPTNSGGHDEYNVGVFYNYNYDPDFGYDFQSFRSWT